MSTERPELRKRPANFVPLSPVSFLKRAADFFGDRTAVIHAGHRYNYREFYARARRLAHALTKAGTSPQRLAAFNEAFLLLAAICALAIVAAWQLKGAPLGDPAGE